MKTPRRERHNPLLAQRGFTLIEMLVQISIFIIIAGFLVTITFVALRVRNQEVAATELSGQLNFTMNTILRLVRESSAVSVAGGSTLTLTRPAPNNPTIITLSDGAVLIQEGTGAAAPLTGRQVAVDALEFIKISNPPAPDVVQVSITMRYDTMNPFASSTRSLRSSASPLFQ